VYRDLLRREREFYERHGEPVVMGGRELRVVWAGRADHGAGFFCVPRHLLDALDAGEPVTVPAWKLGSREVRVPLSLRQAKWPDSWRRVTADDVVERTESPVVDRPPRTGRRARRYETEEP
jgi:hypothetical protein